MLSRTRSGCPFIHTLPSGFISMVCIPLGTRPPSLLDVNQLLMGGSTVNK
jgi:hypothetical protein